MSRPSELGNLSPEARRALNAIRVKALRSLGVPVAVKVTSGPDPTPASRRCAQAACRGRLFVEDGRWSCHLCGRSVGMGDRP